MTYDIWFIWYFMRISWDITWYFGIKWWDNAVTDSLIICRIWLGSSIPSSNRFPISCWKKTDTPNAPNRSPVPWIVQGAPCGRITQKKRAPWPHGWVLKDLNVLQQFRTLGWHHSWVMARWSGAGATLSRGQPMNMGPSEGHRYQVRENDRSELPLGSG